MTLHFVEAPRVPICSSRFMRVRASKSGKPMFGANSTFDETDVLVGLHIPFHHTADQRNQRKEFDVAHASLAGVADVYRAPLH